MTLVNEERPHAPGCAPFHSRPDKPQAQTHNADLSSTRGCDLILLTTRAIPNRNLDRPAVAVDAAGELAWDRTQDVGQLSVLERFAVTQHAGLAGQYVHMLPPNGHRLNAVEAAGTLADDAPILATFGALGKNAHLNRPTLRIKYV